MIEQNHARGVNGETTQLIKLTFLNANPNPEIITADPQEGKVNYFIGNEAKKWRTNIPTYKVVFYKEVYPGIDIKFYGNNRQLEYDIIVKPGADPNLVKLSYEGIEGLKVTEAGDLEITLHSTSPLAIAGGGRGEGNNILQKKPIIYQEIDGKRVAVEGRFKILANHVIANEAKQPPLLSSVEPSPSPLVKEGRGKAEFTYAFEIASYDKSHPLIIDPTLVYPPILGEAVLNGASVMPWMLRVMPL